MRMGPQWSIRGLEPLFDYRSLGDRVPWSAQAQLGPIVQDSPLNHVAFRKGLLKLIRVSWFGLMISTHTAKVSNVIFQSGPKGAYSGAMIHSWFFSPLLGRIVWIMTITIIGFDIWELSVQWCNGAMVSGAVVQWICGAMVLAFSPRAAQAHQADSAPSWINGHNGVASEIRIISSERDVDTPVLCIIIFHRSIWCHLTPSPSFLKPIWIAQLFQLWLIVDGDELK